MRCWFALCKDNWASHHKEPILVPLIFYHRATFTIYSPLSHAQSRNAEKIVAIELPLTKKEWEQKDICSLLLFVPLVRSSETSHHRFNIIYLELGIIWSIPQLVVPPLQFPSASPVLPIHGITFPHKYHVWSFLSFSQKTQAKAFFCCLSHFSICCVNYIKLNNYLCK